MSTEQPQTPPEDAQDIDRTGSPDQGTPEHEEAMRRLGETYEGAVTSGPAPSAPAEATPAEPPAGQEG